MANAPGAAGVMPGVITLTQTVSQGVNIPGGVRIEAIVGTGSRSETIVASAKGGGLDGFNLTYTSSLSGTDGRHFELSQSPIIVNRTSLYKNGVLLRGTEGSITSTTTFSNTYDYMVDTTTGHILLQQAHLVDQGGSFYSIGPTNVGIGTIQNLSLVDVNAPNETWTVKCIGVQRTNNNLPVQQTATFVAYGSVSGNVLDANGNTIKWISDGYVFTNGILSFSINETQVGNVSTSPFLPGDYFTIEVASGVLNSNDSLTATYIAVNDINNPQFLTNMRDVEANYGQVSLDNTLSLGAFLSFQNGTPGVMCVEAAPPLPRRTSYEMGTNFPATSINQNDFIIPFPPGVVPDTNHDVHIFVTNPVTNVETQLLPNKYAFYTLTTTNNPTLNQFIFDNVNAPAGNSFSYSVIQQTEAVNFGQDGYLAATGTNGVFSSSITFTASYVGWTLSIIDSVSSNNIGSFTITGVANGKLMFSSGGPTLVTDSNIKYEIIDPALTSSYLVLNHNIVPQNYSLRATIVDARDASFFDAGWVNALAALETQEIDVLVCLPQQTISAIFENALNHCITMSNIRNKKERVLFLGAINGLTPANLTGQSLAAVESLGILEGIHGNTVAEILAGDTEDLLNYSVSNGYGDTYRAVYFNPDQIIVNIGGENQIVDGFYIAAAAAGYICGTPNIAMPLTNKVISGFQILNNRTYPEILQEQLAAAGVTVLQPVAGGGLVKWGITTSQSGFPEEQEISIVFIRDRVAKLMRAGLAGFIGQPQDPDVVGTILARSNSLLKALIQQNLISAYSNLIVTQDSVEPRQIDISVQVQPIYPLDWIYVLIDVGLIN